MSNSRTQLVRLCANDAHMAEWFSSCESLEDGWARCSRTHWLLRVACVGASTHAERVAIAGSVIDVVSRVAHLVPRDEPLLTVAWEWAHGVMSDSEFDKCRGKVRPGTGTGVAVLAAKEACYYAFAAMHKAKQLRDGHDAALEFMADVQLAVELAVRALAADLLALRDASEFDRVGSPVAELATALRRALCEVLRRGIACPSLKNVGACPSLETGGRPGVAKALSSPDPRDAIRAAG